MHSFTNPDNEDILHHYFLRSLSWILSLFAREEHDALNVLHTFGKLTICAYLCVPKQIADG